MREEQEKGSIFCCFEFGRRERYMTCHPDFGEQDEAGWR